MTDKLTFHRGKGPERSWRDRPCSLVITGRQTATHRAAGAAAAVPAARSVFLAFNDHPAINQTVLLTQAKRRNGNEKRQTGNVEPHTLGHRAPA